MPSPSGSMTAARRILVVEDEAPIADAVAVRLRSEGYDVDIVHDGPAGVEACARLRPDLVVLDLMLPGLDGLEVCKRIQRDRAVPVLMLTARDTETDLVVGLAVGADDYLTKPFSSRELVARVHALLRRTARAQARDEDLIQLGEVNVDVLARRVTVAGTAVHLTPTEFDLLVHLTSRAGRVCTRAELLNEVWGYTDGWGGRTIDSHVKALRRKLGPEVVRTIHGVGYAAGDPDGAAARSARDRDREMRANDRETRTNDRVAGTPPSSERAIETGTPPSRERAVRAALHEVDLRRPLALFPSIKLKLGFVIAAAVGMTVLVFWALLKIEVWPSISGIAAAGVAMAMVWFLSRGMTSPLREMAAAAEAMARGDYSRRVDASSRDEVGALARAFNEMAAELAETDRVRRDLVANVSHELRTPIAALQIALENLVDGVATPDPATFRVMLAQVERLGRLVRQLLDLSRLESGAVPLDRSVFEVEPLLAHAVREQRLNAPGVDMEVSVEPAHLTADGDRERLHQVVANLLENAVRYTPSGGTVQVRARRKDGGVTIEVIDDGPGIAEADRTRVFERFYRADSARASSTGGTGLGLAIARWIVDLHGGDIRPERREPHGCRMVVTIPRRTSASGLPSGAMTVTAPTDEQEGT